MSCSHFPLCLLCYRFDTVEAYVVREISKMVCRFLACDVLSVAMHKETLILGI